MCRVGFFLIVFSFSVLHVSGQLSVKGFPLEIPQQKSAKTETVKMPKVNNQLLLEAEIEKMNDVNRLKPFQFAVDFEVNFSPVNAGEWYVLTDGTQVWQLEIESENALSINLIFYDFELPEKSRLFLFNPEKTQILGSFTKSNNKDSKKFAVLPVVGDRVIIQYEIPANQPRNPDFVIGKVNHDYFGILKSERRPLNKIAGSCNIDVNCEIGDDWNEVKDAICRMIVDGREICTGTLINNVQEDQKPYIISAAHCYDKWSYAETTTYTFNYESPYCASLDGDPIHTVSGAVMRAQYDSLDFALAELSVIPPPEFRPYFAGWNRSSSLPTNTVTIHHPQGDIKKISFDNDAPEYSDFNSDYIQNGFLRVARWDAGVTEAGSSGGPLFNPGQQLIGTLTGGVATCSNPVRDYFNRFELAWDFKNENNKQLKIWLDPENSGIESINGKRFYTQSDYCGAFTNLIDSDEHKKVKITGTAGFAGYWGGTNNQGITTIVEKFSLSGNETVNGISLGIAKIYKVSGGNNSNINIRVYNGNRLPQTQIYQQSVAINNLVADAMNFIKFDQPISPAEEFFIGFDLGNVSNGDSIVLYQSVREPGKENFFYYQKNGEWFNFQESNPEYSSMVNVIELLACNIKGNPSDTPLVSNPSEILIYPNPASSVLTLESGSEFKPEHVQVYNILGKLVNFQLKNYRNKKVQIEMTGNIPGIYFVRVNAGETILTQKFSFVPW